MAIVHKHLILRAEVVHPPKSESLIKEWITELVNDIGMKVAVGPLSWYCNNEGNRGLTAAAIIETSHVVLHCWDEKDPAVLQLDVYSCSDFTPQQIVPWLAEFYPEKIEVKFLDRESAEGFERIW